MPKVMATQVGVGATVKVPPMYGNKGFWMEVTQACDWSNVRTLTGIRRVGLREVMETVDFGSTEMISVK